MNCKDAACASGNGMAAMVLMRDIHDVSHKVPNEESTVDDEERALGEVDTIEGLSVLNGPIADLKGLLAGKFDPAAYFPNARLLGGLPLSSILETINTGGLAKAPSLRRVFEGSERKLVYHYTATDEEFAHLPSDVGREEDPRLFGLALPIGAGELDRGAIETLRRL